MNNTNSLITKKMFYDAASLLESRLYPPPPSRDELRSLYSLSDEYNEKILSMSHLIISRRARSKTLKTVLLAAAIIALLIAFAICINAAQRFLFSMRTVDYHKPDGTLDYTELRNEHDFISLSDYELIVFPSYVPDGFRRDISHRSLANEQRYICNDSYYVFSQTTLCSTTIFNTEKYEMQQVQIGDNIAYYIEIPKQNYISITMECRFGHLSVCGTLPLDECIKILESTINM